MFVVDCGLRLQFRQQQHNQVPWRRGAPSSAEWLSLPAPLGQGRWRMPLVAAGSAEMAEEETGDSEREGGDESADVCDGLAEV
jgi:hypothetical protein